MAADRHRSSRRETWLVFLCQLGLVGGLIVLWEIASRSGWVDREILPPPSRVVIVLGGLMRESSFQTDLRVTLLEVAVSFALVAPTGLLIGFFIGERRAVYRSVNPALQLLMATPKAIFLPIFILIFGIGFMEKVLFAMMLGIFVVILNGIAAVHSVPQGLVTAARAFGATPTQLYTRIYLPAMLPLIIGGLRIGLIFTIFGVLLGEMYAAPNGLGQEIFAWGEAFHMPQLLACVLLVVVVTIFLNELLRGLERYSLRRRARAT